MSWIRNPDLNAITVQRSGNWANKPTGSRYLSWFIWRTISFTANSQYYSLVIMWSTSSRFFENEPNEIYLSDLPISSRLEIFSYLPPSDNGRDLTFRQRRRQWKRRWKTDFASLKTTSRLSQVTQSLKGREFMLELKRGCSTRVQTEMVEFIALPFQSSKNKKIGHFTW